MTAAIRPKFKPGDRFLMLKHADWKAPAATITREGRQYTRSDGYEFIEYVIGFDRPQTDLTDEVDGEPIPYPYSTCMEEFLLPLADKAGDVSPEFGCLEVRYSEPVASAG
ncbi:MAG: hypothetical protein ABI353_22100 [Isosphaeraceae bacterium]